MSNTAGGVPVSAEERRKAAYSAFAEAWAQHRHEQGKWAIGPFTEAEEYLAVLDHHPAAAAALAEYLGASVHTEPGAPDPSPETKFEQTPWPQPVPAPEPFCPLCDGTGAGPRGRCECHCHRLPAPDLVLVRRDSGGVLPDGTTNTPPIDFGADSRPVPAPEPSAHPFAATVTSVIGNGSTSPPRCQTCGYPQHVHAATPQDPEA